MMWSWWEPGERDLLGALRATDLGLSAIVVEKSHRYGGTSATSGGALWIPNHGLPGHMDSDEQAMTYLAAVTQGADRGRLRAYVENGRQMVSYLSEVGIRFEAVPDLPDYFSNAPGAVAGRALFPAEIDGSVLGNEYLAMRELSYAFKLSNRYSLNLAQSFALSARSSGWQWVAAKMLMKYWFDIPWRMKTRRDRRATMGVALIAGLRRELNRRGVPVLLNTGLEQLDVAGGRVVGVRLGSEPATCVPIARCFSPRADSSRARLCGIAAWRCPPTQNGASLPREPTRAMRFGRVKR